ncbi:hypothetical protein [Clostridium sp.]|uniref:hypothetical protein n=1 Tax=Clostridium sp. TaxID=1506 RepID=UPI0025C28070|nr:hypothetical protein [Clostridium sp.]
MIFLKIAKMMKKINKEGIISLEIENEEGIFEKCINLIKRQLKEANTPHYFNFIIDYEFNKFIREDKLTGDDIKTIYVIKHIAPMILENDLDSILSFSRYFCDYKTYDKMYLNLKDFIEF